MNSSRIITGIIYTQFDDVHGTIPYAWIPENIDEKLKILAGVKSISLLTAEDGHSPKSLIIIPFQSYNKKSIIKYLKWEDKSRRGGVARSSITFLFDEENDVIFYKYKEDLDIVCEDLCHKFIDLELSRAEKPEFINAIEDVNKKISDVLEQLRNKELAIKKIISPEKKPAEIEKLEYIFKIVVCGDASVGKSSLILRFTDNAFSRSYIPTIGVNISEKVLNLNGIKVELALWDIAGQEGFFLMRKEFYKGAEGIILVFDLSRHETFNSIYDSYQDIKNNIKNIEFLTGLIIGNKNDLEDREVDVEDARKLAKKINLSYIETSALTGNNVLESFQKIAKNLLSLRNVKV